MLKFFRKIRYDLMEKNKTGKYLKYAIGEIVLVVIGILIALQINNWNEVRKDRLREHDILVQLKNEYNNNLGQLENKMRMRSSVVKSGITTLKYMNTPNLIPRDSVLLHLIFINNDATFDPIQNDLISSGNIRLIQNKELRNLLANWTSDILALQEQEERTQIMVHEIMRPLFHEIGITRDMYNMSSKKLGGSRSWLLDPTTGSNIEYGNSLNSVNAYDILTNKKLEGVVVEAININSSGNSESAYLRNRILKILELIEAELNPGL